MKITCPNCNTKFAIGLDKLGAKGRKLKCSSCMNVWRAFDPEPAPPEVIEEAPKVEIDPLSPNESSAAKDKINDILNSLDGDDAEENDQSAIDDMFATAVPDDNEENDQSAIDDMFATAAPDDNEENDQSAIDDMFATAVPDDNEENDQSAIDDMFATAVPDDNEENDQGAIDDMFATAAVDDNEENDQNAIDDMFDNPLSGDLNLKSDVKRVEITDTEEFEKALPSQSAVYKKPKRPVDRKLYLYWGGLALSVVLVMGVFVIGKDTMIRYFPKSAAAYELYGFKTNILGLEFVNKNVEHITQDGIEFLIVTGSIMNSTDRRAAIPQVRAYLVDNDGNNLFSWAIPISKTTLAAGQLVSFKSGTKSPALRTEQVLFKFIIDKELAAN